MLAPNEIERSFGEREVVGCVSGWSANYFGQFGWNDQNMECGTTAMHSNYPSAHGGRVGIVSDRKFLACHIGQQRQENLYDGVEKSQLQYIGMRRVGIGAQFML